MAIKEDMFPSSTNPNGIILVHATNLSLMGLMTKLKISGNNPAFA